MCQYCPTLYIYTHSALAVMCATAQQSYCRKSVICKVQFLGNRQAG